MKTVSEISKEHNLAKSSLYTAMFYGRLKFTKNGCHPLIGEEDLEKYLKQREANKIPRDSMGRVLPYAVKNGEKHCNGCNKVLSVDKFFRTSGDKFTSQCKMCMSKLTKVWEIRHPKYHNEKAKLYYKNNPTKIKARRYAVRNIKDVGLCQNCGSTVKLERHHPDYSNPAVIIPLCQKCHRAYHAGKLQIKKNYDFV